MEMRPTFAQSAGAAFNHGQFARRFHVEHQDARGQAGVNFILSFSHSGKNNGVGRAPARNARANSPPETTSNPAPACRSKLRMRRWELALTE